jgi:short-subunit dehydrogenase
LIGVIQVKNRDKLRLRNRGSQNKNKFKGKVVLVTGASSGIGRQVSLDFSDHGAQSIILVARTQSKLEDLEKIIRRKFATEVSV